MIAIGIDVGGTSVKAACLRDGEVVSTSQSGRYARPDARECSAAIAEACRAIERPVDRIGLCVPGILDESKRRIVNSSNLPGLAGVELRDLVGAALGPDAPPPRVINDAYATGFEIFASRQVRGRLLVVALGTGVGAAVLDDGKPLFVDGESPGHVGQFDVSVEGHAAIGPDEGRGSLEGYVGAQALARVYGQDAAEKIRPQDAAFIALARALRICHAIYRPHHVCLAGGLGIRLGRLLPDLKSAVDDGLTNIARGDWMLTAADSDFHAARGAARIAAQDA